MEIIGEKIDEWFTIHQIRQFFPPPIFSHARYIAKTDSKKNWQVKVGEWCLFAKFTKFSTKFSHVL